MNYNETILSPDIYEEMAKEYHRKLKNKLPENYDKILNNIFVFFDELNNNVIYLNNLKSISKTNKKHLFYVNQNFSTLKDLKKDFKFSNKPIKSNYCNCLTDSIVLCTNCIKILYSNINADFDINNILIILTNIIENLSKMFGVCIYRKA